MPRPFRAFVASLPLRTLALLRLSLIGSMMAAMIVSGIGCSSNGKAPIAPAKKLNLPPWQGMDRDLFNNDIDASAMGILPPKPARKDQTLWARAQQADIVGRVRVQTFNVALRGGQTTYQLGLQFAEPLLVSSKLESRVFDVTVDLRDPCYGLIKAQDMAIQRRTFVGFVKQFAGADDEIENHFYLAPDSPEVAAVVQEAVAVKEVSQ